MDFGYSSCNDEKTIREHIRALIEEQKPGSSIEAYAAGGELSAPGERFDIVFLDIQVDGMNGIEAARNLGEGQEAPYSYSSRALRSMCLMPFPVCIKIFSSCCITRKKEN